MVGSRQIHIKTATYNEFKKYRDRNGHASFTEALEDLLKRGSQSMKALPVSENLAEVLKDAHTFTFTIPAPEVTT